MIPGVPEADADVRSLFDIPDDVSYLNTAYMSPLPRASVEAGWMALERKSHPWTIAAEDFFVPGDAYRSLVAELLGADADGVAITPSVSFGLSTFASLLPLSEGQVVVVPADEFPSNLLPWQVAADRAGATVERVPRGGEGSGTAGLVEAVERLGERVALVAVPACHWTDGTPYDLPEVARAARAVGAAVAVDLSQSLGAVPFGASTVEPDVVVGVNYKWLLGPYSLGFAWFAPPWRDGMPLEHGWASRAGADDFAALITPGPGYRPGARRYDMGEAAQHHLMPVALASLHLVSGWGPHERAEHSRHLTDSIANGAAALGFAVPPPDHRSPHLLGLGLVGTGLDPATLAGHLAEARVHVSVRGSSVRVSADVYNDETDVDRLLAALASAVAQVT